MTEMNTPHPTICFDCLDLYQQPGSYEAVNEHLITLVPRGSPCTFCSRPEAELLAMILGPGRVRRVEEAADEAVVEEPEARP